MIEFSVGRLTGMWIEKVPSLKEAIAHVRKLSPGKEPYGVWDSQGLPVAIVYNGFIFDLRVEGNEDRQS